jgi:predicted glycosyltransferase
MSTSGRQLRVWIDLANSPHPLLFAPVAHALAERGDEALVTARDHAQTLELTRERFDRVEVFGGESPGGRAAKAAAIARRVGELRRWARRAKPDVALSHNSYAQVAAARLAGIPAVTAMDFEYQPANHLAFRLAQLVLLPETVPAEVVRRQGARPRKVRRYPGLKESLYVGEFEPDPNVVARLGVERGPGDALVVLRTPPSRAIYHRFGNPLFEEALLALGGQPAVKCVLLARHPEQRQAVAALGLSNVVVPDRAVDALALMFEADLVVGAGGTMTREAALLGIPTLSVFAGRRPAVDTWLEERGKLRRLASVGQVEHVRRRQSEPTDLAEIRAEAGRAIDVFCAAVTVTADGRR